MANSGGRRNWQHRTLWAVARGAVLALATSCGGLVGQGEPPEADAGTGPGDGADDDGGNAAFDDAGTGVAVVDAAPPVRPDAATACPTTALGTTITQISCGGAHSCALMSDATVKCWGANASGQLGDGTTTNRLTPVQVSCLGGVVHLAAGTAHTCAVKADGSVVCWGDNSSMQLGIGIPTRAQPLPRTVIGLHGFVEVGAATGHTCARRGDGTVSCWGDDLNGRVGASWDGQSVPPTIPGIAGAAQLALGQQHTCVRLAAGTITCWGDDSKNQRGDYPSRAIGDAQSATAGVAGAIELAANGGDFTCARVAGDTLCWGDDFDGQLGDGTNAYMKPVVSVVDGAHVAQIAASSDFTCGVWVDGTVRCWGNGNYGELGDGYVSHATQSIVSGVAGAAFVATGFAHACALLRDGAVWCWGNDADGELGDGTTTTRSLAAPVHF